MSIVNRKSRFRAPREHHLVRLWLAASRILVVFVAVKPNARRIPARIKLRPEFGCKKIRNHILCWRCEFPPGLDGQHSTRASASCNVIPAIRGDEILAERIDLIDVLPIALPPLQNVAPKDPKRQLRRFPSGPAATAHLSALKQRYRPKLSIRPGIDVLPLKLADPKIRAIGIRQTRRVVGNHPYLFAERARAARMTGRREGQAISSRVFQCVDFAFFVGPGRYLIRK